MESSIFIKVEQDEFIHSQLNENAVDRQIKEETNCYDNTNDDESELNNISLCKKYKRNDTIKFETVFIKYEENSSCSEDENKGNLYDPLATSNQIELKAKKLSKIESTSTLNYTEDGFNNDPTAKSLPTPCDSFATHKSHRKRKTAQQNNKSFPCTYCAYSTCRKSNLVTHLRVHTGEKPFQCTVCASCFTQKASLIYHMRAHTGEKPFKCKYCDYSAAERTSLKGHLGTHDIEKPFQCTVCPYGTFSKAHFIQHTRVHTGEKPFQCPFCEYSASIKSYLHRHMKHHTCEKPFKCSLCDFAAPVESKLTRHMSVHSGEKPFKCTLCKYAANEKYHITQHMRVHTGKKPFPLLDNTCLLFL